MKNNLIRGISFGIIFTLLISSICGVTYYGLENGVADGEAVFCINLIFMIVSAIILIFLKKLKTINKIAHICSGLLVIAGIAIIAGIFFEQITGIITSDYVMPGPTIQIPNGLWLIVILCGTISNFNLEENKKYGILKFIGGEIIAVIILFAINFILGACIKEINNAIEVNTIINNIVQGACGIGILVYSVCMAKRR